MEELVNVVLAVTCSVNVTLEDVYEGRSVPYSVSVHAVRTDSQLEIRVRRGLVDLSRYPLDYLTNPNQPPVTVFGEGHELYHRDRVIFGNLFVRVNVLPHPLYRMDSIGWGGFAHDLHASIIVTLVDYFEGRVFALPHPSGRIGVPPVMVEYQGGDIVKAFNGEGMRGQGMLYVHFEMSLPRTPAEREAIRERIIAARVYA